MKAIWSIASGWSKVVHGDALDALHNLPNSKMHPQNFSTHNFRATPRLISMTFIMTSRKFTVASHITFLLKINVKTSRRETYPPRCFYSIMESFSLVVSGDSFPRKPVNIEWTISQKATWNIITFCRKRPPRWNFVCVAEVAKHLPLFIWMILSILHI